MIFVFSALALYLEEEMEGCEGCGEDVAVSHLLLPITPDCSSDPGSRDPDCPSLELSLIYYLSTVNFKGIETQIIIVYRYFLAAVVLRGGRISII